MHSAWCKAIKVLPHFSVVHKQDWFVSESYKSELQKDDLSFLDRSFERHFNERPYLNHKCYLFLTKTSKERMRQQSNFSTLCRGRITPKELNHEMIVKFMESVEQFERIINDTGYIKLHRLSDDDIVGTETTSGLIERYMALSMGEVNCLEDIDLSAKEMRIGDKMLCLHTLSDTEDLPGKVSTDNRYERLSTDRSDCRLSFASPVGLLLPCNHIYNQYVLIDDHDENLAKFEKTARNMNSLSKYSRSNAINKEWIDRYLNEAHSYGLTSVRCHCNIMAWSDDAEELRRIKNDVGGQLATMGCMPRHNTIDCPTLFWAATIKLLRSQKIRTDSICRSQSFWLFSCRQTKLNNHAQNSHFSGQPLYGQVIKLLDKSKILYFSRENGGERYTKRFNCWIHLVVMLYAVIMRFDSLREITASLLAETRKLAHLGITFKIGRSTLADANKRRPEAIFEYHLP